MFISWINSVRYNPSFLFQVYWIDWIFNVPWSVVWFWISNIKNEKKIKYAKKRSLFCFFFLKDGCCLELLYTCINTIKNVEEHHFLGLEPTNTCIYQETFEKDVFNATAWRRRNK